ncbi:MAG: DEAD/DEAH box helicase [Planctomycetaceae bacterium]
MTEDTARDFKNLSPLQQYILQVLAISESATSLDALLSVLKQCGWATVKSSKSGFLTQALLKPELKTLRDLRLIESLVAGMAFVEIDARHLDAVVQQSVLNGNFELLAGASGTLQEHMATYQRSSMKKHQAFVAARRRARIAFYRGDVAEFGAAKQELSNAPKELSDLSLLNPFNAELYERTPAELQPEILVREATQAIVTGIGSTEAIEAFDSYVHWHDTLSGEVGDWWVNLLAACGDLDGLRAVADANTSSSLIARGCLEFLTGQHELAEATFTKLTNSFRKESKKRGAVLPPLPGLMHVLLLLRKNDATSRGTLKALCAAAATLWPEKLKPIPELIIAAAGYADSPSATTKTAFFKVFSTKVKGSVPLVQAIAVHLIQWFLPQEPLKNPDMLIKATTAYEALGFGWLVALCEDAQAAILPDGSGALGGQRHAQLGTFPMLTWIQQTSLWKRKLDSLRQIVDGNPARSQSAATGSMYDERMIWELEVHISKNNSWASPRPFIQKLSGGSWTGGRPVALQRLHGTLSKAEYVFLTEQDRAVCRCIVASEVSTGYRRYTETVYNFDYDEALTALIGHPLVFTPGNRTQPLEIMSRRPQLVIRRKDSGLQLELDPQPHGENDLILIKDGSHRLVVVTFTKEQMKLAGVLEGALDVPKSGEADVLATAKSLSSLLSVQSDITFGKNAANANVKSVDAESRPHLHLLPFHAGLRAEFFVQPFGDSGPFFAPGQGGENVFAEMMGESLSTRRNLKQEYKRAQEIVATCRSLANSTDGELSAAEFSFADDALEMLMQIEPLREAGKLMIHWPQGQSMRIAGSVTEKQLRVRIDRDKDWFAASGEVVVDELLQMDLMKLMDLVSASPGRFIALDDGRFLALTEQLRKRVSALAAHGERKGDTLRFPQIRASAFSDVDEWCTLKADKHWKACLKRIQDAGDVVADVPSTLNAELRDYQIEGFRWLCRLAHWGAGACLADDMGLGKTLQAIAMLLRRGADGPALVIAPMSVCFNWEAELHRFAPTLNPRMFGAGDRDAFFAELGPRDVVITSYGLLHTEAERLQAVQWNSVILDEAQAIKNTLTKRSQAAMSLTADFRMILTGTPIENHLGELWNLFQFINPGLLGSMEHFHQRFALPIERDHNRDAGQQLKRLVQPFLLRRTKTQVLSELPPRIEVTVPVTLTDEETVLYESARRRAVKELAKDSDAKGKHLRILAEIMRLRRACCHPSLLLPDCNLPGAKLTAFSETIDELLENKHKALVFSQFVDHLSILRAELDRKNISYQYLDGSTSMKDRKKSVDAFQNGEGDVFLISLKAGGTGLNLTAADYVLHMDPWWNPAVEDQAADRAHRMGQLRPVTIYRFITRGTIEDKILELHATKRDLADSLLEGTDTTGRLSAEELLALIR